MYQAARSKTCARHSRLGHVDERVCSILRAVFEASEGDRVAYGTRTLRNPSNKILIDLNCVQQSNKCGHTREMNVYIWCISVYAIRYEYPHAHGTHVTRANIKACVRAMSTETCSTFNKTTRAQRAVFLLNGCAPPPRHRREVRDVSSRIGRWSLARRRFRYN